MSVSPNICGIKRKNAKVALGETREIARGLAPFLVLQAKSRI